MSDLTEQDPIWPSLADSYLGIETAWRELMAGSDDNAAKGPWREDVNNPSVDTILTVGAMSGVFAGGAIGGHLNLLSRAYWPPRTDLDITPVDQLAIYPPARAVLEATAIVCWALDKDLDVEARALRSAGLWLWSATSSSTNDAAHAVETIRNAGFTVAYPRSGRGSPALIVNGQRKQLSIGQMLRAVEGKFGEVYGVWSSASHSDPFHIYDSLEEVGRRPNLVDVALKIDPLYHLLTAGIAAMAVDLAGRQYGEFYGRPFEAVAASCKDVHREMVRLMVMIDPTLRELDAT